MEENTQAVQEQPVNNVLDSLSDSYLAKKRKNRKITFSIISFFALALAVVIIVLSCIKINTKPEFIDGAVSYQVTINGSEKMLIDDTDKDFKEFNDIFNESFSYNYLTALFSNKFSDYEIIESSDNFHSNTTLNNGMSSSLKSQLGDNYVRVKFDGDKVVKYSNGEVYKSIRNTNYSLKFNELYFNLSNVNEEGDLTFYLGTTGYLSEVKITKITVKANTYALYEYVINN